MNTAEQAAVPGLDGLGYDDLGQVLRDAFAAEAPAGVIAPWPPPHRLTRWQRWRARRRKRAGLPVATWAVGLCYLLGSAIALELAVLALRRYGGHIDWVRFAGSWPA